MNRDTRMILKVLIWLRAICFCCFYDTVDNSRRICSIDCINHLLVLMVNGKATERPFRKIFSNENKPQRVRPVRLQLVSKTGCNNSIDGANASVVVYTMVEKVRTHDLNIYEYFNFQAQG